MQEVVACISSLEDRKQLREIWKEAFGDEDAYLDLFFQHFGDCENIMVGKHGEEIVSMVFLLPVGTLCYPKVKEVQLFPVSMNYAFATKKRYQGNDYGSNLMRKAMEYNRNRGLTCNVLCPAEDEMFPLYERKMGYQEFFYVKEAEDPPHIKEERAGNILLKRADAASYNQVRETYLKTYSHVEYHESSLQFQKQLCQMTDGDLFLLEEEDWVGCACIERLPERLFIKELLLPERWTKAGLDKIYREFDMRKGIIRFPWFMGKSIEGTIRRFAVLNEKNISGQGYLGFAFD